MKLSALVENANDINLSLFRNFLTELDKLEQKILIKIKKKKYAKIAP
jgi:hypothetical protein